MRMSSNQSDFAVSMLQNERDDRDEGNFVDTPRGGRWQFLGGVDIDMGGVELCSVTEQPSDNGSLEANQWKGRIIE